MAGFDHPYCNRTPGASGDSVAQDEIGNQSKAQTCRIAWCRDPQRRFL